MRDVFFVFEFEISLAFPCKKGCIINQRKGPVNYGAVWSAKNNPAEKNGGKFNSIGEFRRSRMKQAEDEYIRPTIDSIGESQQHFGFAYFFGNALINPLWTDWSRRDCRSYIFNVHFEDTTLKGDQIDFGEQTFGTADFFIEKKIKPRTRKIVFFFINLVSLIYLHATIVKFK